MVGLEHILSTAVVLILAALIIYVVFKIGKMLFGLLANTVLGFISIYILNTYVLTTPIPFDLGHILEVAIVAIFGILGVIALLILHYLGITLPAIAI